MRYDIRGIQYMRDFTLDERKVRCPNASTLGFGRWEAKPGDFITFEESKGRPPVYGRVLGRVADHGRCGEGEKPNECEGWLVVLKFHMNLSHAHAVWVDPTLVLEVGDPPRNLMRWALQPRLPSPDVVLRLASYGTLSEHFIADPKCGPEDLRSKDRRMFDAPAPVFAVPQDVPCTIEAWADDGEHEDRNGWREVTTLPSKDMARGFIEGLVRGGADRQRLRLYWEDEG